MTYHAPVSIGRIRTAEPPAQITEIHHASGSDPLKARWTVASASTPISNALRRVKFGAVGYAEFADVVLHLTRSRQNLAVLKQRRRMIVARAGHTAGKHGVARGWVEEIGIGDNGYLGWITA